MSSLNKIGVIKIPAHSIRRDFNKTLPVLKLVLMFSTVSLRKVNLGYNDTEYTNTS